MTQTSSSSSSSSSSKKTFFTPLSKANLEKSWDAIVIGSGMGGMACAAALSKYGRKVLVLEQHYVAGGFTHTFSRKGFTWDVGVHCLGEMHHKQVPGRILNWLSNDAIQMTHMGSVYEKLHYPDGFQIEFPSSPDGFRKSLEDAFPKEKKAIGEYFRLVREVANDARAFFAFRALPPWLARVGNRVYHQFKTNYWARTTAEVLSELTSDPKLRAVMTAQWGYYGSTPSQSSFAIHALTVQHFWGGGYYPTGGAQVIAESLASTVNQTGGQFVVRASVKEIIVEGRKAVGVRTVDGKEFFAPKIISAAGARTTVETLLPTQTTQKLRAATASWSRKIAEIKQSPAYICLYLGFEGDVRAAGATTANQWFFETWDMEEAEWEIRNPATEAPILYVSFPSLKDPKHDPGPEQRNTGEVVTFVPWDAFREWSNTRRGFRDPKYLAFKKSIEERLLNQLRKHAPELMKKVKYYELSTPLSTLHFTRAPQGAIYGLEATPRRFTSTALGTRTPIKNLYMAGGDVATLGVTGALVGGVLAAGALEPRVFGKLL